jgi:hypothetical protein
MFKEATVAYFKALSRHLLGGTEKNHQKPQWEAEIWTRELPNTKQARVLTTRSQRSEACSTHTTDEKWRDYILDGKPEGKTPLAKFGPNSELV